MIIKNKFENWLLNDAKQDNGANYKESTAKDYTRRVFIEIPKYFNLNILDLDNKQIESLIDQCVKGISREWNISKHSAPSNALKAFLKFKQEGMASKDTNISRNKFLDISKVSDAIDQTRFILLSGFVLCEGDLRNFAHIKKLNGITHGLGFQEYDSAQKAIDRLKSEYLDVYLEFRNELFKKLMKVNLITLFDTTTTEAEFDSENQCALYCVIMERVFHSQSMQEIRNILEDYISSSHLEG